MRARCRHHTSLVPGLMGAMGKCTSRRGRALRNMMRTHDGTARVRIGTDSLAPRGLTTCRGTRKTMASTLNGLLTVARGCPSLGTGRGFLRLRTRLRNARGHVGMTHAGFGGTTRRCGATVHHFPGDLFTNVFNFSGRICFRTTRNARTTPRIGF